MTETTSPVNRVLDWAECRGRWYPFTAGAFAGVALDLLLIQGGWPGWPVLAAALILILPRPVGTSIRRTLLLRQARRMVAARRSR